jgi:hypothetical protein
MIGGTTTYPTMRASATSAKPTTGPTKIHFDIISLFYFQLNVLRRKITEIIVAQKCFFDLFFITIFYVFEHFSIKAS